MTHQYYRGALGAIIVYSVTDRTSFDHLDSWLDELGTSFFATQIISKQLEDHGDEGIQRLIIGNKCDLVDERQVSTAEG